MPIRVVMLLFCWMISFLPVLAEEVPVNLEASFPYSLNGSEPRPASPGSRYPLLSLFPKVLRLLRGRAGQ